MNPAVFRQPRAEQDRRLTDEELSALALAGDWDADVDNDAMPLYELLRHRGTSGPGELLPHWYIPVAAPPTSTLHSRRPRLLFLLAAPFAMLVVWAVCACFGIVAGG